MEHQDDTQSLTEEEEKILQRLQKKKNLNKDTTQKTDETATSGSRDAIADGEALSQEANARAGPDDRVKIREYHGHEDIVRWIQNFERQASCRGWSTTKWAQHAASYLEGDALEWCDQNHSDSLPWTDFKKAIIRRFGTALPKATIYLQLSKLKKKPEESIKDFATRLLKVSRRSEEEFSIRETATIFLSALPPIYHTLNHRVDADNVTMDELADMCSRMEAMSIGSSNNSKTGENNEKKHCDICGMDNHTTADHDPKRKHRRNQDETPITNTDERTATTPRTSSNGDYRQQRQGPNRLSRDDNGQWRRGRTCWECGSSDHMMKDCPKIKKAHEVMAMLEAGDADLVPKAKGK